MCSKADLTFSDVSDVWMRNFWKMLEKANVDRECFKMKKKLVFKCFRINVDVA